MFLGTSINAKPNAQQMPVKSFTRAMQQVIDRFIILCAVIVSITLAKMYFDFLSIHTHNVARILLETITYAN